MTGPLDGIRVLEVAAWTFVPAAAALLGDMGAEIIKVEPPTGDPQRALRNALNASSCGPNPFVEIPNHGKRSVTLDLKVSEGRAFLDRLVMSSDVFMTSYLPSTCADLGIDVNDLRAVNPQIVYARGTGWGRHGPMAETGGFDLAAAWAVSGLAHRLEQGTDGAPSMPPAFFDLQASVQLSGAVSAALFGRERTGTPSVIDVALMNVAMWAVSPHIVSAPYTAEGWVRTRQEPDNPLSNWYRTADSRWIYLVLLQPDRFWREVCDRLGRPDLVDDPRYANSTVRYEHRRECAADLDAAFLAGTLSEWIERFAGFEGVWSPAYSFSEVREHPQVAANGFLTPVVGGDGTTFQLVTPAAQFDTGPTEVRGPAPEVGQNTEEVLLELGLDWDEISAARDVGALG